MEEWPLEPTIVQIETPAMLSWAAGIMAVSLVGVSGALITLSKRMGDVRDMVSGIPLMSSRTDDVKAHAIRSTTMHEHPGDYGFGTRESERMLRVLVDSTSKHIAETERVLQALTRLTDIIEKDIEFRTKDRA